MIHLITEVSKYLCMILMLFYTYHAYMAAIAKTAERRKRLLKRMRAAIFLIHGVGFLVLYLKEMRGEYLFLYIVELLVFLLAGALYRNFYPGASGLIFNNMMLFIAVGYVMIARLDYDKGLRQFFFTAVMLTACLVVPKLIERMRRLEDFGAVYTGAGILLLFVVLLFGVEQYGAKSWLSVGGILVQPSEFVKVLFVFGMAALLKRRRRFSEIVWISALAAVHVILMILERDLGGALIFFAAYIVMLYAATGKTAYMAAGGAALAAASGIAYVLFGHVQTRVEAYLHPFENIAGSGYQIAQSLFAIGTGGWFGMGLSGGMPQSVPVAESDFIFSAIAEEFGGIFAVCIILLCVNTFLMIINISLKIRKSFYKLISLGFSVIYMVQAFLNIGGAIRFIPSTGVTLPLVSYGGSSVIVSILMFQVIQGLYVLQQKENAAPARRVAASPAEAGRRAAGEDARAFSAEKEEHPVNQPVTRLAYGMAFLCFAMILYLVWFEAVQAKTVINSTYNARQTLLEETYLRGEIKTSDGVTVARTVQLEDGTTKREYPYGGMYAHVIGRTRQGRTGVELAENFTMLSSHVSMGEQIARQFAQERIPGDSVVTTLNSALQETAYDALGDYRGAVVVLEPATGKVLAMVSKPDYDPNTVAEDWSALTADEKGEARLLNRAVSGVYAPGSTFKIWTLLEYMRENPDYGDFSYTCTSEDSFYDVAIHCAGGQTHGTQTLKEAFGHSCNTAFAKLGVGLDLTSFSELCKKLLFGQKLPGAFQTEKSSFPLDASSPENEIPQGIIGLGKTEMTPLHNAVLVAAVANGGVMMEPYVVDHIEDADGQLVRKYTPTVYKSIMTPEEADVITEYMTWAVENGTASKLSGMKVSVAGKTGTATYDTQKEPHAWFVGFAPAEDPQIAVCVLVESAGSGSSYAVPIAKKLIEAYFSGR